MNEITHEGRTYILKEKVEDIISDRLKKYANKSSQYEETITKLQSSLDEMTSSTQDVNLLREKISSLETSLSKANSKYERHQAINKHGISNPSIMRLLEWEYQNIMDSRPKKDRENLSDWLEGMMSNPESAPDTIRPHLPSRQAEETPSEAMEETASPPPPSPNSPPDINLNSGAMQTPPKSPMLSQIGNLDYYRQNREILRQQWRQKNRKG